MVFGRTDHWLKCCAGVQSAGSIWLEALAPVRPVKVQHRTRRHDTGWIDGGVATVVVRLDVFQIDCLSHARPLIEFADIAGKMLIVIDSPQIALEMPVV